MAAVMATFGYGKANLKETLATYASMKVSPPFERISAVNSGQKCSSPNTTPVGLHQSAGALITCRVSHESGTVILLQSRWTRNVVPFREGSLFLRLRTGAPVWQISAKLPTGHGNICGDRFAIFTGEADLVNRNELKLLGLEVSKSYTQKFMNAEELEECYYITQLAPETVAQPSLTAIATPTGLELREIAAMPKRRLIIR
jgi:hypothetical protein